jgi:hypothetical protein
MFKNNHMIYGVINVFWLSMNIVEKLHYHHHSTSFTIYSFLFDILLFVCKSIEIDIDSVCKLALVRLYTSFLIVASETLLDDVRTVNSSSQQQFKSNVKLSYVISIYCV